MADTTVFTVRGMTCGHCVAAVETGVAAVPGVLGARADLTTGRLEVDSETPLDPAAIATAVDEAGYEVAS